MEDLVGLYAALPAGGRYRIPRLLQDSGAVKPEQALLSPSAAWYLTDILADAPLPAGFSGGGRRVAFKTGTSYGFRDAWCVGYGSRYTVAVWVGRPDGGYVAGLSGLTAAAPVLLEIFDLLADPGVEPLLQQRPDGVRLVSNSALPAALRRLGGRGGRVAGSRTGEPVGPRIRFPLEGSLLESGLGNGNALLIEGSGGAAPFFWLVNGRYLATTSGRPRLAWEPPRPGEVTLTLLDSRGRSDRVRFRIGGPGE